MFSKMATLGVSNEELGRIVLRICWVSSGFMGDKTFCYHSNMNGFDLWISVPIVKGKQFRAEVTD